MTDVYEQDKQRILGITRGAEISQRVQEDLSLKAAIALEQEQRAGQQRQAEARQAEALAIAQAEGGAVEQLRALQPLYAQRQAAARQVIEAVSALWRIESDIRAGLSDADRPLHDVEALLEPTRHGAWRAALRERAGLPVQHLYAPDVKPTSEAQAVGVTVVRAVTAGVIQPGAISVGRDVVNLI